MIIPERSAYRTKYWQSVPGEFGKSELWKQVHDFAEAKFRHHVRIRRESFEVCHDMTEWLEDQLGPRAIWDGRINASGEKIGRPFWTRGLWHSCFIKNLDEDEQSYFEARFLLREHATAFKVRWR